MDEPTPTDQPPTLQLAAAQRWLRWPHTVSPWLHEEIGARMAQRLAWIRLKPAQWLDWYPLHGGLDAHQKVHAQYPQAQRFAIETSDHRSAAVTKVLNGPWWRRWWGASRVTMAAPPDGSLQMVWANMSLHIATEPLMLLRQWHKMLAVDGFLMFTCLGPDTLRELQQLHAQQGWPAPSQAFTDMHDWGDMLIQAGFAEPVMDMERLTLTYDTCEQLVSDLRALGRNLNANRFTGLRGKAWRERWLQALRGLAGSNPSGKMSLTVEVIYGHALKPVPRVRLAQESSVALEDMRSLLGKSRDSGRLESRMDTL